jgi:SMC interacting uncharacterized protein involved in chromosome segregation
MIEIRVNSGVIEYRFIVDQVRRQWSGWQAAAVVNPEVPKAYSSVQRDSLLATIDWMRKDNEELRERVKELVAWTAPGRNILTRQIDALRDEITILIASKNEMRDSRDGAVGALSACQAALAQTREELEHARAVLGLTLRG